LSVGEIAKIMECKPEEVSKDIRKLLKYHEVKALEVDKETSMLKYKCKRRMCIYYVETN